MILVFKFGMDVHWLVQPHGCDSGIVQLSSNPRQHHEQAPSRAQFSRPQREERLPIPGSLAFDFGGYRACAPNRNKMARNHCGHSAEPHLGIGGHPRCTVPGGSTSS